MIFLRRVCQQNHSKREDDLHDKSEIMSSVQLELAQIAICIDLYSSHLLM